MYYFFMSICISICRYVIDESINNNTYQYTYIYIYISTHINVPSHSNMSLYRQINMSMYPIAISIMCQYISIISVHAKLSARIYISIYQSIIGSVKHISILICQYVRVTLTFMHMPIYQRSQLMSTHIHAFQTMSVYKQISILQYPNASTWHCIMHQDIHTCQHMSTHINTYLHINTYQYTASRFNISQLATHNGMSLCQYINIPISHILKYRHIPRHVNVYQQINTYQYINTVQYLYIPISQYVM